MAAREIDPLPPHGIERHYAILRFVGPGPEWKVDGLRHEFSPVVKRGTKK